jgi:TetR/AcrR family transcriptional repressor of nem operon
MRYPAEHKQATRDRIVRAAARRFRTRGGDRAAIADLMRDLQLTHGGFYRHFRGKEELYAEAFAHALQEFGNRLAAAADQAPVSERTKALIDAYLCEEHSTHAAEGCPVAALASEAARRPATTRRAFERAVKQHVMRMAAYLPGKTEEERIRTAAMLFSGMAGTLNVARLLGDDRERQSFLERARGFYRNTVGG